LRYKALRVRLVSVEQFELTRGGVFRDAFFQFPAMPENWLKRQLNRL
jgi:hypothetical protein